MLKSFLTLKYDFLIMIDYKASLINWNLNVMSRPDSFDGKLGPLSLTAFLILMIDLECLQNATSQFPWKLWKRYLMWSSDGFSCNASSSNLLIYCPSESVKTQKPFSKDDKKDQV